jgi:hypothetical protein
MVPATPLAVSAYTRWVPDRLILPLVTALLITLPLFAQAPWVRLAPMQAALFTAPLMALAIALERHGRGRWQALGVLLVGFCGSWLGGALFWGWCRLHPLWHLPVEAFALPLALGGLRSRWRLAGAFYLGSLLGTAATDAAMAITGLMDLWPQVLQAPLLEAPVLLQRAALSIATPRSLTMVGVVAALLLEVSRRLWRRGGIWRVSATALATTLAVDGLFLVSALLAPRLSGLI